MNEPWVKPDLARLIDAAVALGDATYDVQMVQKRLDAALHKRDCAYLEVQTIAKELERKRQS